jgi:hypothetical protein
MTQIQIKEGSPEWKDWRKKCTVPIPGRFSALYFLCTRVLGLGKVEIKEGQPLIQPRTHYGMCLFAEHATGIPEIDSARVQMIAMPRGTGKSAIVTGARTIQRLLQNRDHSVGIANETGGMAEKFLAQIKLQFESNDFLRALFPEHIPDDFRHTIWKVDEIVIKRDSPNPVGPSVMSCGVGATKTGTHVNEWLLDDLISQNAADAARKGNYEIVENTNHWIVRLPPMLNAPEDDRVTIVHTPWFHGDSYDFIEKYFGNLPDDADLSSIPPDFEVDWNLQLPTGERQTIRLHRRGDVAVFRFPALQDGESTFPQIWTTDQLLAMSVRPLTAPFFAANFLLKPSAGIASAFDTRDLRYYERDATRKFIDYHDHDGQHHRIRVRDLRCFISVDPAFSESSSAARTAIPVVGTDGTRLFLLEDFAEHGLGPDDIASKTAEFASRYSTQEIFLETIVAQRALLGPIKRALADLRLPETLVTGIPSHGRTGKEMRIWGLEPWFRDHKFYIHKSHTRFSQEFQSFPQGALRDLLDAISFQIERGWERLGPGNVGRSDWVEKEEAARARIRRAVGTGGGY